MSPASLSVEDREIFSHVDPAPSVSTGPLGGVRVVLPPNLSVRGWPTEAGSRALEGYVALEDATVVERLRAAGARIVGSTRMAELSFGLAGDTTTEVIGRGCCDVALVTDTMGEARYVASRAEALGLKPSYGVIPRFGLVGLVPSMEVCGIVAKRPSDLATVLGVLAGPDERDPSMLGELPAGSADVRSGEGGVAVAGVIREDVARMDPAEARSFRAALQTLEAKGLGIREIQFAELDLFPLVHHVVGATEASSSAGKYDGVRYGHRAAAAENWNQMYLESRAESFGTLVKSYLFQGAYYQFENYSAFEKACRIRRRLVQAIQALFATVDAVIGPTRRLGRNAEESTTVDAVYDAFGLCLPSNVTGCPSLSIPGFVRHGDTDLGLQVTGPWLSDARLLSLAARLLASPS
jgi:aspartyl-tRNA(Asn)/glutamyl-tRNA(Gln) amidotransferase subunit A